MRFKPRSSEISLAHAAICALIALPLLAAQMQNASIDPPKQDTHGIIVANMDASVKPGDDFNQYANGGWIKRTEIPPDRGRVGGRAEAGPASGCPALSGEMIEWHTTAGTRGRPSSVPAVPARERAPQGSSAPAPRVWLPRGPVHPAEHSCRRQPSLVGPPAVDPRRVGAGDDGDRRRLQVRERWYLESGFFHRSGSGIVSAVFRELSGLAAPIWFHCHQQE